MSFKSAATALRSLYELCLFVVYDERRRNGVSCWIRKKTRRGYTMSNDNVIAFQPSETVAPFSDVLSELVRQGARQIIAQAVEAELKEFLAQYQSLKDDQGRAAIVRNGYLPERTIMTGVGEVEIQVPKVRDRSGSGIKFNSS
jgi:Transposase, Mutator family